ncbi:MAG: glycosyltransferase family 2 protein [Deltaproteobacteria bacterium]|nr:glycosyltransferase family 2 protein [Deltaproteobacteria bacterium]
MAPIPPKSDRTPKVSVVMALYNRAHEIIPALESVIAQDYDDYEVIVVDDGSTDGSDKLVRRYKQHVRLVRQKNGGVGAARNTGIREARGQYLAYCDSDDVQLPFRLRAQAEALDRHPEAAMVFSDFKTYIDDQVTAESHLRERWLGPTVRTFEAEITEAFARKATCRELGLSVPEEYAERRVFSGEVAPLVALMHVAWGCVQMSRIEQVRAVGGHWEGVRAYEDWCLTAALSKRAPLVFMDLPTCLYRVHPEQLTGRARLNNECYRDVIHHIWRSDPDFYAAHKDLVDLVTGTAYAQMGEVEAADGRWAEAEFNFQEALRHWPRLKRAYVNLALAAARNRVPGVEGGWLGRRLPPFLQPKNEARG